MMKAYTYCTPSHQKLLDKWLAPSVPPDLELICKEGKQECPSGAYLAEGFNSTMRKKVELILHAIDQTWEGDFLFVDADVQFFGQVTHILRKKLEAYEIVAQDDSFQGQSAGSRLCAGMFACRSTPRTQQFWRAVLRVMEENPQVHDQDVMNSLRSKDDIRMAALPRDLFWSNRRIWEPGHPIKPPQRIVAHHANFTLGPKHKHAQLGVVREIVRRRSGREFHGTRYGGYCILGHHLNQNSVVYSVGIGEDASFDLSLIEKYGLTVFAFDPTPKAKNWVDKHLSAEPRFVMHPYGIFDSDKTVRHYLPENSEWVSCSTYPISDVGIDFPMRCLRTAMNELGHARIDVLKIDVEGAECRIINDMLACGIEPQQLLVEFHDQWLGLRTVEATIRGLQSAGYQCFARHQKVFCFVKR